MSPKLYSLLPALIWIASGVVLLIYAIVGLSGYKIIGIENFISFLSSMDNEHVYLVSFGVMFLEGMYLVGNVLPGSAIILILAMTEQSQDYLSYLVTIACIFVGWCLAGVANVLSTKIFLELTRRPNDQAKAAIHSKKWMTWFPAFRANYEVSQVLEGNDAVDVLRVSTKIKFFTSFAMMLAIPALALLIQVSDLDNQDGFISLLVVALLCFVTGFQKIKGIPRGAG